eukprot:COSAG04_NODE_29282_length_270_cov_0.602339_1_plen_67_part_10
MIGFNFAFSTFTVFGAYSILGYIGAAIIEPAIVAGVMWTLAKTRPFILQHLRTNTEQFANQAVRGQM